MDSLTGPGWDGRAQMERDEGLDPYGRSRTEAWARYRANHPEVLAAWGQQNGRWPKCTCAECDPQELLPRPNILLEIEGETQPATT